MGAQTPVGGSDATRSTRASDEVIGHRPFNLAELTPADAPAPTIGAVDAVELRGDHLHVRGWLLTTDGDAIDHLQVYATGQPVAETVVRIGLPSPEVALQLGHEVSSSSGFCRYEIEVPVNAQTLGRPQGDVLTLAPSSRGRRLRPFAVAHDTAIPLPTEALALRIGGGFLDVALEFMAYFQELGRIGPGDRVLEIGCGLGRMAYPLAYYLDDGGAYIGFDIDAELIAWANDTVAAARPKFRFVHADINNQHYNPRGSHSPTAYRFPPASGSMDAALAISLFTHLPADAARHYLRETARVLRPGGTVLLTAFLVDDAAKQGMADGQAILHFGQEAAGGLVVDAANPEAAIGFPAATFLGWMADAGLQVAAVYPGNWSGREPHLSFQDIVVARRTSGPLNAAG